MKRSLRHHLLLRTLTFGCTAANRLVQQFGVCVRTIYRDIQALRDAGYDVRSVGGRKGGFWLATDSAPLPLALSSEELREVVLAVTRSAHDGTLVHTSEPQALVNKLLASLPRINADRLRAVLKHIPLNAPSSTDKRVLHAFEAAVYHQRCLNLVSNEPNPIARFVQPTGLELDATGWRLVATDRRTGQVESIPVPQVVFARVHPRRFGRDPERGFMDWIRAQPQCL